MQVTAVTAGDTGHPECKCGVAVSACFWQTHSVFSPDLYASGFYVVDTPEPLEIVTTANVNSEC